MAGGADKREAPPEEQEPALVCALCGKPAHERDRVDDGRLICDNCLRGTATR